MIFFDRFFTPPKLLPLGLDLAELSGGGFCPSQFEGLTHDGRDVYCRYRGGWLSIQVSNKIGADVFNDCTILLDVGLEPPLDGSMALWELCKYTGITINGKTVNKPDKVITPKRVKPQKLGYIDYVDMIKSIDDVVPFENDLEANDDLSGEMSFYNAHLESTIITARAMVDSVAKHFDNVVILQWDEVEKYKTYKARIVKTSAEINKLDSYLLIGGAIEGDGGLKWGDDISKIFPNHW